MPIGYHHTIALLAALAIGFAVVTLRAELEDPATTADAALYFEPGEMVADPLHNLVYLIDKTNTRVVAYDTEQGMISHATALFDPPEYGIPIITHDGTELWVPLPGTKQIQKLTIPDLQTVGVIEIEPSCFVIAEGADGHIYSPVDSWVYKIDSSTGQTLSRIQLEDDYHPLITSGSAGNWMYTMESDLSASTATFEAFRVNAGAPPTRVGFLGETGKLGDNEFVVDDLHQRIYRVGAEGGIKVWDIANNSSEFWSFDSAHGSSVCFLTAGDSAYGCSSTRIRRFDRADGTPLFHYDDILRGTILARHLKIAPNGRLLFVSEQWTGNATRGFEGYLYFVGMIGADHVAQIPVPTGPAVWAGEDRTVPFGATVALAGRTVERPELMQPSTGLYAWWKLDGTSGTTATDSSGAGRHLPMVGAQPVPGVDGGARRFGLESWIDLGPITSGIETFEEGTICFWFRTDAAGEQVLFGSVDSTSDPRYQDRLRFLLDDGLPRFEYRQNAKFIRDVIGGATFNDGEWHHAALIMDIAGDSIVIDGSASPQGHWIAFRHAKPFDQAFFGRGRTGADDGNAFFSGDLDDIRMFSRKLSLQEVAAIAADLPARESSLAWQVVDGPGDVSFADAGQAETTAQFSAPGEYRLRLQAGTGDATRGDLVHIRAETDSLLAYEAWGTGAGLSGPALRQLADPDYDGLCNLGEYCLSSNPLAFTPTGLAIRPSGDAGDYSIGYDQREDTLARGLSIVLQRSPDLRTWVDVGDPQSTAIANGDGTETVSVEVEGASDQHWRLRFQLNGP